MFSKQEHNLRWLNEWTLIFHSHFSVSTLVEWCTNRHFRHNSVSHQSAMIRGTIRKAENCESDCLCSTCRNTFFCGSLIPNITNPPLHADFGSVTMVDAAQWKIQWLGFTCAKTFPSTRLTLPAAKQHTTGSNAAGCERRL